MAEDTRAPAREQPNLAYYLACRGRWRCALDMQVRDRARLRDSEMSVFDRATLRLVSAWPAWLGRLRLDTSVHFEGPVVVHATRVRWLGIPMMLSVERIELGDDGHSFTLAGEQRVAPLWWRARSVSGAGEVDEDSAHARYSLTWLGAPLHQSTVREGDRLALRQRGPGFEGTQHLRRFSTEVGMKKSP
ncbi:hypothetical protein G6O69_22545 [Pseudenhygromyxa sp. WMMC2535]|uniref:hypothetical protein n=1 Tax=Pseudenhygromyxa sp. WMMC2535 TaxID=2712867 RepID=UPI00155811BD|nr:hypothetical protein [Pseudenhygromyxa sp. WMMC2535]NVB40635.1 hypothetical protein [Pseudenhygromyxa sp. WMMC2535]